MKNPRNVKYYTDPITGQIILEKSNDIASSFESSPKHDPQPTSIKKPFSWEVFFREDTIKIMEKCWSIGSLMMLFLTLILGNLIKDPQARTGSFLCQIFLILLFCIYVLFSLFLVTIKFVLRFSKKGNNAEKNIT